MTMSLFNQFLTPKMLGIPLVLVAMMLPPMLLTTQTRLMPNRIATTTNWLCMMSVKQLMAPLNKPCHAWSLPLLMVLSYLLLTNLLGLLPYTFTPTTQLSMNIGLAIPLWLATVLTGLRNQPTMSMGHLLPMGTPAPLIPALIIIETASLLIRPMALGVRLTANLTAGHLLIQLVSTALITVISTLPMISTLTLLLLLLLTGLELAVAMIQAYVFVLLVSLYLQENT